MARIKVTATLDYAQFTQQAAKLQAQINQLQAKPVKLSVDTSGINASAVNALARLTQAQNALAIETQKTKQAELTLTAQRERTAQATQKRVTSENQLATQMERTATAEEQARTANTRLATEIQKTATEQAKATTEAAKLATQQERTATAMAKGATATDTASTAQKKVSVSAKDAAKQNDLLAKAADTAFVKMLQWQVLGTVVSSVVRAFRNAVDTMKEVDTKLTVIRKVTGASETQLAQIEAQAYKTASAYGVAADSFLEAAAAFARAGYGDQSSALAELAVKTQLVGDVDAETAQQFLLSVDAAYKYKGSIEELSKVLDGANEIDNNYATSIQKIAEGLGKVAPIAAQTHVSIDELSAAIGTITAVTQRSGTEAATAFRALLLNIVGDTKTEIEDGATWTAGEIEGLRDVIRLYAPDAYAAAEATGSIIDPMEAIGGLAQSMKDGLLTEQQLMSMVSDIGGKLRTSQLLALVQNWDMYESMLTDFGGAVGSADKEVSNALTAWDAKLNILKNTFTEFIQNTIDSDWIKKFLDGLTSIIKLLDNLGTVLVAVGGALLAIKLPAIIAGFQSFVGVLNTMRMALVYAVSAPKGLSLAFSGMAASASVAQIAVGALTAAVTIGLILWNRYKQKQEEAKQATLDAAAAFESQVDSLDSVHAVLADETSSRDDLISAISGLNSAYANELSQLEDVNEVRQRGIELLEEESKAAATEWMRKNGTQYDEAKSTLNGPVAAEYATQSYGGYVNTYVASTYDGYADAIEKVGAEIDSLNAKKATNAGLTEAEQARLTELEGRYSDLTTTYDELKKVVDAGDKAQAILNGTYEAATEAVEEYAEAIDSATEAQAEFNAFSDESQDLFDNIKTAGDAFAEFAENGDLTYSTLKDIRDAFGDLDAIDDYIDRLSDVGNTTEDVNDILAEMAIAKINNTYSTEELANADATLIAKMLEEAGVSNATAVANDLVTQAKYKLKIATFDSVDAAASFISAMMAEGSMAQETAAQIASVAAQQHVFNNTSLNVNQKVSALAQLAASAYDAGAALRWAASVEATLNGEWGQTWSAAERLDYLNRSWAQFQKSQAAKRNSYLSQVTKVPSFTITGGGSSGRSSGGGGSGGGSSSSSSSSNDDPQLTALEDHVSLLKSELKVLEAQGAPTAQLVAKHRQIADALQAQINYLRSIGGDQEEINNLTVEWYGVLDDIKDIQNDLWDELEDYIDSQLDALDKEKDAEKELLELEEKRKAVIEAQNALLDAQNERTIRIYNAATGQWEWIADASKVKSAKESLQDAQSNLSEAERDYQISSIKTQFENLKNEIMGVQNGGSSSRSVNAILSDLLGVFGGSSASLINNQVRPLLATIAALTGAKTYDSGGILYGMGGIKATMQNEAVLGPELTKHILSPVANDVFRERVAQLGYLYGATPSMPAVASVSPVAGSSNVTNNGGPYYFNGVQIGDRAANSMTLAHLAQQMRNLAVYSGN